MVLDTEVSPNGDLAEEPKSGGEPSGGKGKEKDEVATLRAQLETRDKTISQLTESERYWANLAQAKGKPTAGDEDDDKPAAPKVTADPDDDDDDPAAFVDELSASGKKALEKRGFIRKKDVEPLIEQRATEIAEKVAKKVVKGERTAMTHDAELIRDYPELNDPESELFKETSAIYQAAVKKDPSLGKSTVALMQAAEVASLRLKAKARDGAGRREEPEDLETGRTRRIREQSGDRTRRAGFDDADDDSMGPQARTIAAALGVKEDDYKAERARLRTGR